MSEIFRSLRVRDWSFILLILAVAAACVRLGFWQLDRLEERRTEIERITARLDQTSLELTSSEFNAGSAYRRAVARGQFDALSQILLENQSLDGQPGFHLITPLKFPGDGAVLVDRGWIPFETGIDGNLDAYAVSRMVEVAGILIPSVEQPAWGFLADPVPAPGDPALGTWRFLTIPLIQQQVNYPLAPLILVQTDPLDTAGAAPQPDPRVELDEGPHLGYAIQWFAFATIAIVGGGLWIRRQQGTGRMGESGS